MKPIHHAGEDFLATARGFVISGQSATAIINNRLVLSILCRREAEPDLGARFHTMDAQGQMSGIEGQVIAIYRLPNTNGSLFLFEPDLSTFQTLKLPTPGAKQ